MDFIVDLAMLAALIIYAIAYAWWSRRRGLPRARGEALTRLGRCLGVERMPRERDRTYRERIRRSMSALRSK